MTEQIFLELQYPGEHKKIVRAFVPNDLADWCVHGTELGKPFGDVPKRSKKWTVTHIRTTRRMPEALVQFMNFATAIDVAAYLDENCIGASQVEHREGFEVVGWDQSMQLQVCAALLSFHHSKKPILTEYAEVAFGGMLERMSQ